MQGLDIAQVRQLAQQMRQDSDQLRAMATKLTGALQSTPWMGRDRERFLETWQSQHVRALTRVATLLGDAATMANREANQQEQASR